MRTDNHAAAAPLSGAEGFRFAIVFSRFNDAITESLRDAARTALLEAGAGESNVEVVSVPGAFELPQAARSLAETGRFDAIVCLGCVIRGATPHFEYIASACAHGITAAAASTGVPMAFGVLTTNSAEEALERVAPGPAHKGREAADAAMEMARLFAEIGDAPSPLGYSGPGR